MKIVVTGSRHWAYPQVVQAALDTAAADTPPWGVTILHGANEGGADAIADGHARARGWVVRPFPGVGRKGLLARNRAMIRERPDLLLAFVAADSVGTWHTITVAQDAGITIRAYGPPATRGDARMCREAAAALTRNRGWADNSRRALALALSGVEEGHGTQPGLLAAAEDILASTSAAGKQP